MMRTWIAVGGLSLGTLAACVSDSGGSGTTGRTVALHTRVELAEDVSQPKTNALGWSVTLSEAYLSLGPLYYYSGDPVLSLRPTAPRARQGALAWASGLLVGTAHAHPGHYIEGAAMGQMLEPTTLDLLAGPRSLGDGEGVTGLVNSARFTWQSPPAGPFASKLGSQVVLLRGTATKADTTVKFLAQADGDEVRDGDDQVEVAGCAFGAKPGQAGVEVTGDGTVTLRLTPSVWLAQVDFAYVAEGAEGAPTPDADGVVDLAGTLAWQGFIRGVKKGTAYEFTYRAEEGS